MNEEEIFLRALELAPGEKLDVWLEEACGGDPDLRRDIEELLEAHHEPAPLFKDSGAGGGSSNAWETSGEQPGDRFGRRYKLIEKIGRGGMGTVWLAEQSEPVQRKVALKIIKLGMDTREVVARFEAERQALARMDHPGIAKVFDAGVTDTGRPYFVMELVEGQPLTEFCDERKMETRQRLHLFIDVCRAVQHAHQKGVIHRDIKPSNILVTERDGHPVAKVIDFGVAKAVEEKLTARTLMTGPGRVIGTLGYMSPEQAGGEKDIDTRSDIYSLGVVLYELLSGTNPFGAKRFHEAAFDAALKMIREEDPPKPSTQLSQLGEIATDVAARRSTEIRKLVRSVRGDLDWIVMRSLEKDRNRRYETANAFARDVEHYLNGEPVAAAAPTAAYRFSKFTLRNKASLGATAAFVLLLIAAAVVSLNLAHQAQKASKTMEGALYQAHLAEAIAVRQSGRVGQRTQALAAIAAAAEIDPTPELRNEAIKAMALPDLELLGTLDVIPEMKAVYAYDFESDLLLTARNDRFEIQRHRVRTGETMDPIPLPPEMKAGFNYSKKSISRLTLSPGGAIVALYGQGLATLNFYEVATGRKICRVVGVDRHSSGCLFLDSAKRALVPLVSGGIVEINLDTGEEGWRMKTDGRIRHLSTIPNEKFFVASLISNKIQVIDSASGMATATSSSLSGSIHAAVASPNGRLLAYGGSGGNVRCMSLVNRPPGTRMELNGHSDEVNQICFVLGGDYLITSSLDGTVRLWSPTGPQLLRVEGETVLASRDGDRVLIQHGNRVRLFRIIPSQEVKIFPECVSSKAPDISFSPGGAQAAISGEEGTLLVSIPEVRTLATFESSHWDDVDIERMSDDSATVFGPHGRTLVTTGRDGVRRWDLEVITGRFASITSHALREHSIVLTPTSRGAIARNRENTILAVASQSMFDAENHRIYNFSILDPANGEKLADVSLANRTLASLEFDPRGRWLAGSYTSGDGFTVWSTETWKPIATPQQGVASMRIAVNHDGGLLASGSQSEICLWDTSTWECLKRFPCEVYSSTAQPVDFSPDGRILACGFDSALVQLRRVPDGAEIAKLTLPIVDRYKELKFSPDGRFLAVLDEKRAFFFDLEAIGRHLGRLGLRWEVR